MPTVTIKMTDQQFAALDREARARGMSKAGVLRDAFLGKKRELPPGESAYDSIADLVGSVSGPGDLSTNPKYMKDYGKPQAARRK